MLRSFLAPEILKPSWTQFRGCPLLGVQPNYIDFIDVSWAMRFLPMMLPTAEFGTRTKLCVITERSQSPLPAAVVRVEEWAVSYSGEGFRHD